MSHPSGGVYSTHSLLAEDRVLLYIFLHNISFSKRALAEGKNVGYLELVEVCWNTLVGPDLDRGPPVSIEK